MELRGSRTEKNLITAFAGESQARNRYTYFASRAKSEGYVYISKIFAETSDQESEHAKRLFKFMTGGEAEATGSFPFGKIEDTLSNLKAAAAGEHYEWSDMYPSFAKIAIEEGFIDIGAAFNSIAVAEKLHETRYLDLAARIEDGSTFERDETVLWYCTNCGYWHEGPFPPKSCPACAHPQAYYRVLEEKWTLNLKKGGS